MSGEFRSLQVPKHGCPIFATSVTVAEVGSLLPKAGVKRSEMTELLFLHLVPNADRSRPAQLAHQQPPTPYTDPLKQNRPAPQRPGFSMPKKRDNHAHQDQSHDRTTTGPPPARPRARRPPSTCKNRSPSRHPGHPPTPPAPAAGAKRPQNLRHPHPEHERLAHSRTTNH